MILLRIKKWLTVSTKIGYQTMIVEAEDYDTEIDPNSWAKIFAMRHALSKYPDCKYIWYLDQHAYIMDPSKSLEEQVTNPRRLESLMIKDYPVVPPDSIIKTFSHLRGEDVEFVVSQDKEGLVHNSVVIRNGEWAKFFIETWFDPTYRGYNFQKAERHALVSFLFFPLPTLKRKERRREGFPENVLYGLRLELTNTYFRNTLCNGIPRFYRNSPSYPNEHWHRTHNLILGINTKKEILSSCSPGAPKQDSTVARPSRHIIGKR